MDVFTAAVLVWTLLAPATLAVLLRVSAPYGRHARPGWGPTLPNHWGWFWMELPALLILPLMVALGPRQKDLLTWTLTGAWTMHYLNRTLVFPFRLRTRGKRMPVVILLSAMGFNAVNGLINGWWLGHGAPPDHSLTAWTSLSGLLLFALGMGINRWADARLIALRARGADTAFRMVASSRGSAAPTTSARSWNGPASPSPQAHCPR